MISREDISHSPDKAQSILTRHGVGRAVRITQRNGLRFTSLVFDEASVALVRCGTMHVQSAFGEWVVREGEALAVASGLTVAMTNQPGENGVYQGQWLTWSDTFFQIMPYIQAAEPLITARLIASPPENFFEAFDHACSAMDRDILPDSIAAHRAAEVLLWLALEGISFDVRGSRSLSGRVRLLLRTDLGKAWAESEVGKQVGMSPATLRRYLAAEGTSFRAVLADVRMQAALSMLQASNLSVNQIAQAVGYASQSRFAARFRSRFGFQPSTVRGHRRK